MDLPVVRKKGEINHTFIIGEKSVWMSVGIIFVVVVVAVIVVMVFNFTWSSFVCG